VKERRIHEIFEASVLLKGAHALIECLGGFLLFFVSAQAITGLVKALTQNELNEDPGDLVATTLRDLAGNLSVTTEHFYAWYLLSHGVIKLVLVIGLLRNQLWAYPASLVALGLFMAYQLYRFSFTHGIGLLVLTVFDLAVVVLIWHEYRIVRSRRETE
jgi:uncharacterized membrane protein